MVRPWQTIVEARVLQPALRMDYRNEKRALVAAALKMTLSYRMVAKFRI
jgi:hypothetical protein